MALVHVGTVKQFSADYFSKLKQGVDGKLPALKLQEEAGEVTEAYKALLKVDKEADYIEWCDRRKELASELADAIQAVTGICHIVGINDMSDYIDECYERNAARGRCE